MFPIKADDWNRYLDGIFELISNDEAPLYESKMNAYLEETVAKYLYPSDDYVSLTEIARKYDAANPSYLIQSWLRSRNTVEFLATWERKHNSDLSNQSSETLVFSRKIGILILVPYVFSLVFALMSRNKGNFLFRLPRPPYQAVLRKFVSLPS